MAKGQVSAASRDVQTLFSAGTIGTLTDGQLLERFTTRRGDIAELAFAALIERHGPMVLRVCRAILHDHHDAQDALQATFLVLVRRASSLWVQESLGPWLHQVAYRTASCARSAATRRKRHEGHTARMLLVPVSGEADRDDFGSVLHEELKPVAGGTLTAAVVVCLLEGLTHEQAALRLGWPVGTLQSRLARGREQLRGRLTRRGLAPAVAALGAELSASVATAPVPATIANSTIQAAICFAAGREDAAGTVPASVATLTESVLRTMMMSKLKMVAVALSVGVAVFSAGALAQPAPRPRSPVVPAPAAKPSEGGMVTSRPRAPPPEAMQPRRRLKSPRS